MYTIASYLIVGDINIGIAALFYYDAEVISAGLTILM